MKIGIDASFLARDTRGMGRATRSIVARMLGLFNHEFYFIMVKHKSDEKSIQKHFPEKKLDFMTVKDSRISMLDVIWFPWSRIDFFPSARRAVTIHDLAPYRYSHKRKGSEGYNDRKRIKEACEAADMIITPSDFSRSEICTFLEIPQEKIEVIPHGVEEIFKPQELEREKAAQYLDRFSKGLPYILFVGNVEKRKNIDVLLYAFEKAKKEYTFPHKLIVAGKCPGTLVGSNGTTGWSRKLLSRIGIPKKTTKNSIVSLVEKLSVKEDVVWLGEVTDEDLLALYNLAKLFVFPSFYEGFGLPILEAMACGVPCIVSEIPPFVEVAQDAVAYFDPKNAADLAEKMWLIISDSDLTAKMRKRGFEQAQKYQWDVSAHKHIKVLEELR
ncbi:MAG: glycosyltransferase family 1 protein [Candidatus Eremiobacteraeota bacterium]|nr:glycosyltransferase family 1 protein [Candidatus Eremiobacteraeota bacterium]